MKKKLTAPLLVAMASIILLLIAGICVKNRGTVPVIFGDSNAPQATVTGFFDALIQEDYELCADFVSGYASLGFDNTPDRESERMVYEALLSSYSFQILGDTELSSNGIYQPVLFTALKVDRLSDNINARFMSTIENCMNEYDDYSAMYDDNGQYSDQLIETAMVDILSELLEHPERYYVTEELRLELTFEQGEWRLVLSSELVKALTGNIGEGDEQ